jgi:hypothetical protein
MNLIGRGKGSTEAWREAFGDSGGFEERWRDWWLRLPENPTDDQYRRATLLTLTSFFGRAVAQRQAFASMPDFTRAASMNELKSAPGDVLPRSILAAAMRDVQNRLEGGERFSLEQPRDGKLPVIVVESPDGKRLIGRFSIRNGRIVRVWVE